MVKMQNLLCMQQQQKWQKVIKMDLEEDTTILSEVGDTPKFRKKLNKILDRATSRIVLKKGEDRKKAEVAGSRAWARLHKEDITPGRTEVNPTSHHYQTKRLSANDGTKIGSNRLKGIASLKRSITSSSPSNVGKVPLKLPTPVRDHTYQKPKPLNLRPTNEETILESRKAEIVKTAYKKAKAKKQEDKFQPDPELQSSMARPQGD